MKVATNVEKKLHLTHSHELIRQAMRLDVSDKIRFLGISAPLARIPVCIIDVQGMRIGYILHVPASPSALGRLEGS